MRGPLQKSCQLCGKPVVPRRYNRPGFYYPRRCEECFGIYKDKSATGNRFSAGTKGWDHPRTKPLFSERIKKGYVQIKVSPSGPWPYKHRWIMEQHLGRKLENHEVVHHIDDDPLNNNIDNLKIMKRNCHGQMHFSINRWSLNYDACISCGTVDKEHGSHGRCVNCASKLNRRGYWARRKNKNKWARKYDCCIKCGHSDSPHNGRGLCSRCWKREKVISPSLPKCDPNLPDTNQSYVVP